MLFIVIFASVVLESEIKQGNSLKIEEIVFTLKLERFKKEILLVLSKMSKGHHKSTVSCKELTNIFQQISNIYQRQFKHKCAFC